MSELFIEKLYSVDLWEIRKSMSSCTLCLPGTWALHWLNRVCMIGLFQMVDAWFYLVNSVVSIVTQIKCGISWGLLPQSVVLPILPCALELFAGHFFLGSVNYSFFIDPPKFALPHPYGGMHVAKPPWIGREWLIDSDRRVNVPPPSRGAVVCSIMNQLRDLLLVTVVQFHGTSSVLRSTTTTEWAAKMSNTKPWTKYWNVWRGTSFCSRTFYGAVPNGDVVV